MNDAQPPILFISHSSKDADLAEAFAHLLERALALQPENIRCSSVNAYRLPAGVDVDTVLRREVNATPVLIGLLTRDSVASAYVSFELGARWGAHLPLYPVIARGLAFGALQGPVTRLNPIDGGDSGQLQQLLAELAAELRLTLRAPHFYDASLRHFLTLAVSPKGTGNTLPGPSLSPTVPATPLAGKTEDIRKLILKIEAEYDDVYVEPNIPRRIRQAPINRGWLKSDDDLIGFIDNSSSGVDGLAILPDGVVWRNERGSPHRRLSWNAIIQERIRADRSADYVTIGSSNLIDCSGSYVPAEVVAKLLRDIVVLIADREGSANRTESSRS